MGLLPAWWGEACSGCGPVFGDVGDDGGISGVAWGVFGATAASGWTLGPACRPRSPLDWGRWQTRK